MNPSNYSWAEFADREGLAKKLADDVVTAINDAISLKGQAIVALSGGSTPAPLFAELVCRDVEWSKVVITLVDERWVDESHELSNAAFLRGLLLDEISEAASFVPLYRAADSVDNSLMAVLDTYCVATHSDAEGPAPFDVVILGMGEDGHTASFFPDADNIVELVDPMSGSHLLSCNSPSTQVDRVTWSLPRILSAGFMVLHITGEKKKTVYQQALENDDATTLPIRAAIFQEAVRLNVYYAD